MPAKEVVITDRLGARLILSLKPGMSVALVGLDGTGKSTAVEMLETALIQANVAVKTFHWYSAHKTCFLVPLTVLRNRWSKNAVQIFDRSIYDNFAVWLQRVPNEALRDRLMWLAVRTAQVLYPRFDALVHLTGLPDTIHVRRPEMTPTQIARGQQVYTVLGGLLGARTLDTITVEGVDKVAV